MSSFRALIADLGEVRSSTNWLPWNQNLSVYTQYTGPTISLFQFSAVTSSCYTIMMTYVNSAPSSGCRVHFPPIAATARGCPSGVALPPASPLSRVCPRRRGGSPSGDLSAPPALSLRGRGMEVLIRPPSAGRTREGDFGQWQAATRGRGGSTPTQTYLRTGGP